MYSRAIRVASTLRRAGTVIVTCSGPPAVVTRPAIVLADEPTGNLDSENSALVLNMFQELNYRFNQTIIMITHNPEAAAMCKRIVQMRDGHIVEQTPTVRL